jgi:hypothetical protein
MAFVGPWPLFSFLILLTVGRTPWTVDQPVTRPLSTHRTTQTQNNGTQTSMPWVGFELERAKTIHALDLAATTIGTIRNCVAEICHFRNDVITHADVTLVPSQKQTRRIDVFSSELLLISTWIMSHMLLSYTSEIIERSGSGSSSESEDQLGVMNGSETLGLLSGTWNVFSAHQRSPGHWQRLLLCYPCMNTCGGII